MISTSWLVDGTLALLDDGRMGSPSRGSRNTDFFGGQDGGALVPRSDNFLLGRRRQRVNLGVGRTVQCIMYTRADYHGALWKESLRGIVA